MKRGAPPLPPIDLARVVDLASQLEADARIDPETLRRRDRTLGRKLSGRVDEATARVAAWLDRQRGSDGPTLGERALRGQRLIRLLLVGLGLILGASMALAVFAYDGTHPVNVVQVLAIFVGLQALLLTSTALLALPASWRRRVPGLAALQDVLGLASPGRWQPALRRILPPAQREALDRATGLALRHQRLYGNLQKWSLLVASQGFAVAFHAAALATAVALVTFSDLAFGWSTTLRIDAASLHRWTEWLAWPWTAWGSDAVPDLALIAQTQYFRGGGASIDPARSGAWWRFLLLCMACYGLAPRVLTLSIAAAFQRVALRRAFRDMPGVADLRDRLDSRWVATGALGEEPGEVGSAPRVKPARSPRPAGVRVVRWSGVPIAEGDVAALVKDALGSEVAGLVDGGAGAARDDATLVADLAAAGDAPALLVKAWEPPLLELLDLLAELRGALGEGIPILVLPLAEAPSEAAGGGLVLAGGRDARTWTRRLDTLGDPMLDVVVAGDAR